MLSTKFTSFFNYENILCVSRKRIRRAFFHNETVKVARINFLRCHNHHLPPIAVVSRRSSSDIPPSFPLHPLLDPYKSLFLFLWHHSILSVEIIVWSYMCNALWIDDGIGRRGTVKGTLFTRKLLRFRSLSFLRKSLIPSVSLVPNGSKW